MVSLKSPIIIIIITIISILIFISYNSHNNNNYYNNVNNNIEHQTRHIKNIVEDNPSTSSSTLGNSNATTNSSDDQIKVPLNLLNIFPSANVNKDSGEIEKLILSNSDPITILFNRPVVPLGVISHYYPFSLKCLGSTIQPIGNYRWVTSSIARFDIANGNWPTNLNCTFSVNLDIQCYDGTKLSPNTSTSTSISFTTPQPTITIQDVISEKSSNFTNNHWSSIYYQGDKSYFEIPPDSKIKFSFSDQFDTNSVVKSLVAYQSKNPNKLIPFKVISCPNVTSSSNYNYYYNNRMVNYYLCIEFIDSQLKVGEFYKFEFKKGTRLNEKSGPLKEGITIEFSGLKPFKFDFVSDVLLNVIQKLAISHGLSKNITSSMLVSQISIKPSTDNSKPLSLTHRLNNEDSSLLIHIIGSNYGVNYTINVNSNSSITDCWGLPLIGNSWNFTMSKVSSYQLSYDATDFQTINNDRNNQDEEDEIIGADNTIKDSSNSQDFITFHQNSNLIDVSIYHGDNSCEPIGSKKISGYPITKSNLEQALRSYINGKNFMKQKPKKTVILEEPTSTDFYNHSLDSKTLWKSSGVYLEQHLLGLDYKCNPNYKHNFISSTDVGVSFLTTSSNSLGIWVTKLSDGSNLKDAMVSLYQIVDSTEIPNDSSVILFGGSSKKTSSMGIVEFKSNRSNINGIIVIEYGGDRLYIAKSEYELFSTTSSYYIPQNNNAAIIVTDRKLYNAGDKINCKVYMNGDYRKYRFTLRITWRILNSVSEFSQLIDVDDDFGTSNLTIDIPELVSMGSYSILVQGKNANTDSGSDVYFYGDFLISDPRIPSGIISIKTSERFIQWTNPSLETTFKINTNTYIGTPLPNKNVTIHCTYVRNSLNYGRNFNFQSSKSILTNDKGYAKLVFKFNKSEFKDGDVLSCVGSYLDSTGSLIKESPIEIHILSTEYSIEIQADYNNNFGYPSSASAVLLNQTSSQHIKNITIELKLISTSINITEIKDIKSGNYKVIKGSIFNIWSRDILPLHLDNIDDGNINNNTNKLLLKNNGLSCRFKSGDDYGQSKCYIILPSSLASVDQNYFIMATMVSSEGGSKSTIVNYLKFNIDKKSVFSTPTNVLSFTKNTEYYTGKMIDIRYYNPFKSATFTIKYGCGNGTANPWKQVSISSHGFHTLSFKVPAGCESKRLGVVGVLIGNKYGFKLPDTTITSLTNFDTSRPNPQTLSLSFSIKDHPIADLSIVIPGGSQAIFKPGENASFTIRVNNPITKKPITQTVEACIMVVDKRNLDIYGNPIANGDQLSFENLFSSVSDTRFNLIHNYHEMLRVVNRILDFDRWGYLYWSKNSILTKNISNHFQNSYQWLTTANFGFNFGFNYFSAPSGIGGGRGMDDAASPVAEASKSSPSSNSVSNSNLPINTNFKTTPLFIGKMMIDNGIAKVNFKLPDDLTTFSIRVYIITKDTHKLYSKESTIISRKDINMISFSPRFVRTGDRFEVGVSITRINQNIDVSDLRVTAKYKESCIEFDSSSVQSQDIVFSNDSKISVNIVFPLTAQYQCNAIVYYFLEKKSTGEVLNGITSEFSILGKQLPLYVGSSFEVKANSSSAEFLTLPDSEGGIGSLKITVGVGNYPIVEEKCLKLLSISKKRLPSSIDLLSQQVTFGALSSYSYNSSLIVLSQQVIESINEGFYVYSSRGISWYPQGLPEFYPNLYAIVLNSLMDITDTAGWSIMANQSIWNDIVDLQLNTDLQNSINSKTPINKELIGLASIGLGYYWAPKDEDLNDQYSFNALTSNITDNCPLLCQTYFALAEIIRGEYSSTFIDTVVENLKSASRIQGRTAYIVDNSKLNGQSNTNILELTTFASILFTLRNETTTPLLSKMINFIAIGGSPSINPIYLYNGYESWSSQQEAISLIAITFYDKSNKNVSPDLNFTAYQPSSDGSIVSPPLLEHHFSPNNSDDNIEKQFPYSELSTNKTIHFSSVGKGQISVAVGIEYTPTEVDISNTKPIYNGIYVEKIIVDISGSPNGNINKTREFYRGQEVMVILSVTLPDFMNDVYIEDPASGGIEPIDNNIDNSGPSDARINYNPLISPPPAYLTLTSNKMVDYQYDQINNDRLTWFYQPFSHRETRRDKVIYQGSRISPGSYQVSYRCIVTSNGHFTMPPTKVYSSTQPEVFGTSKGFNYLVK